METRMERPRLASQAPKVIRMRDISPSKEILLEKVNNIIKTFIVAASNLKRTLKRCLYCSDNATNAITKPRVLAKIKGYVLMSLCGSSSS